MAPNGSQTMLGGSGASSSSALAGAINAGAIINTPAKRMHGQGRPPIREQEVIDVLNPLINKDHKTIEDMRLESKNLFDLVSFINIC